MEDGNNTGRLRTENNEQVKENSNFDENSDDEWSD